MKKLVLALVIGVFSLGAASAQTMQKTKVKTEKERKDRTPQERAQAQAKRLQTHYNLTDEQTTKVKDITLAKASQVDAIKAKYGDNRKNMHAEMKVVKTTWENQLRSILTPDQYAQFEKERTEKAAKRKHNGEHKGKMNKQKYKLDDDDRDDD